MSDAELAGLLRGLEDSDTFVRRDAVRELGVTGDPRTVDYLRRALKDKEDDVRSAAAEALGQIGPSASSAAGELIAAASEEEPHDYPHSVDTATDALIRIGISAAPALVRALPDDQSIAAAAYALGHMGPSIIPTLTAALRQDAKTARGAAQAAGYLGKAGAVMVPDLVSSLDEGRIDGGRFAMTMEGIGPAAGDAVPQLIDLLENQDPGTREVAASALLAIGDGARPATPALKKALEKEPAYATRLKIEAALRRLER
jgi:HEAT repeat protein